MIKIEYFGHSCFLITDAVGRKMLIDPYLSGNPLAPVTADKVHADYIFVTHNHNDHIGDAIAIAKRTGATVYGEYMLVETVLAPAGIQVCAGSIGGRQAALFGSVKYIHAVHGSGVPGGIACGYLFEIKGKKVYHAGDTALIQDMEMLAEENVDLALLPIGDVFTMGPEDAAIAASMIKPRKIVPMHYNTLPAIKQRPEKFKQMVERRVDCEVIILKPGESLNL